MCLCSAFQVLMWPIFLSLFPDPFCFYIHQGDVLMKFDGVPVANEGTVPFQAGERIAFTFLASQKYVLFLSTFMSNTRFSRNFFSAFYLFYSFHFMVKTCWWGRFLSRYSGDMVEVEVLRGGEVTTLQTALKTPTRLVGIFRCPSSLFDRGCLQSVMSCVSYLSVTLATSFLLHQIAMNATLVTDLKVLWVRHILMKFHFLFALWRLHGHKIASLLGFRSRDWT